MGPFRVEEMAGVGQPRSTPFVGRAEHLAVLDEIWAGALEGAPARVVIEGAAGVGKTALVRQFVARSGARSLVAEADPTDVNVPYGVAAQLLEGSPRAGSDPLAVGADLLERLGTVQEDAGLVLVVDDLQWVDGPSLHALTFALRRMRADRVLAVLACRDAELPPSVGRLVEDGHTRHLSVNGLSIEELTELAGALGRVLSPRALQALWEHTDGSPLHARALLRELGDEVLADTTSRPFPAPRTFARLVQLRLAGCSVETEQLVAAASVLGNRVSLADAAALADLPDPTGALGEAVDADLIVAVSGSLPLAVGFSHPLVRSAVYHDLNPARRSILHLAAATRTRGAAAIEHRVAATLTDDPDLAREVIALAGEEAAEGSFAAAAAHLRSAAGLVTDPDLMDRLRLDAAQLLLGSGDYEEASVVLETTGAQTSARGRCVAGHLSLLTGRQRDAERQLTEAWEAAQVRGEDDVAALAATALAHVYLFWQRYADAAAWADRALALDVASPLTATAHGVRLVGLLPSAGEEAVERASAWLGEVVDDPTPEQVEGLVGRGIAWLWAGRLEAARRDLTAAADSSRSWRSLRARILALGYLAETEFRLGRWDESIAHGGLGASLAEDATQAWLLAFSHAQATSALAVRGLFEDAREHVDAARAGAELLGDAANATFAAVVGAQLAFAQGDAAEVADVLLPLQEFEVRNGVDEPGIFAWRELLAGALIDLGRTGEAAEVLRPFARLAQERGRAWPLAASTRVGARLEAARGNLDAAAAAFGAATAHAEASGMPFERALLHDDHGRALRRSGRRRDAADKLRQALQLYEQLGADPFAERCRRELAACGVRQRPASLRPGAGFTPQEIAVVRLLVTGRRNREIANELVVSIKTVEYHLGNIYLKLGVTSRAEVIARHASGELASGRDVPG